MYTIHTPEASVECFSISKSFEIFFAMANLYSIENITIECLRRNVHSFYAPKYAVHQQRKLAATP